MFDFNDRNIGRASAEAYRDFLEQKGNLATGSVSPSTVAYREKALRNPGKRWYEKRYEGGRIGPTAPDRANLTRVLRFSGRLLSGLFARPNPVEKSWTVNVPANRLVLPGQKNSTSHNMKEFMAMLRVIDDHLPWLRDPGRAFAESSELRSAARDEIRNLVAVASKRNRDLIRKRREELAGLLGMRGLARLLS